MAKKLTYEELEKRVKELEKEAVKLKKAEEETEKLSSFVDAMVDGVVITDLYGKITYINKAVTEHLGYKKEELIGKTPTEFVAEKDLPKFAAQTQDVLCGKPLPRSIECLAKHRDGKEIPMSINISFLYDRDGKAKEIIAVSRDVSESKRAEEQLRQSEESFRHLSQATFEGIAIHEEGVLLKANEQFFEIFGYEPQELLGKQAIPMSIAPESIEFVKKQIGSGATTPYEVMGVKKDGTKFPMEIYAKPFEYQGRMVRVAAFRDITDRKRAKEALRESEEKYRTILDSIEEAYFEVDIAGDFTFFNDSLSKILGYSKDELAGMNNRDYMPPESSKKIYNLFNQIYKTGNPIKEVDYEIIRKDGSRGFHELSASLMQDEAGQPIGFRGIAHDITEVKLAEEALKESEEKYRTLFENASEAIVVAQDGVIKFANPKGEELYGYSKEELASRPLTYFIHEEDREMVGERHERRLRGEAPPSTYPFRIINKAGDIKWVELNVSPFSWDNRPAALCFMTDVTERKKAQEEKRKIETQLLQSEKMASIGQLAAGVAHEINNPTGFVSSNLETLSDYQNNMFSLIKEYKKLIADLKETVATAEYPGSIPEQMERIVALESEVDIDYILDDSPNLIKESLEGTERIKKIVIDLKDFAHPGDQELKYTDLNGNLESTLNIVSNELKYKATVTKDYGDLPEVQCHPQEINQVFMNLLVNAAQAIEKHGEIRIVTRAVDRYVEITISDTGAGIPEENLSKIFDPFFTTKDVGKGTGLGLNIAYNIIQNHKGTMDVKSEAGTGTTFIIRIPVGRMDED